MSFTTLTYLLFLVLVFGLYWAVRTRRCQNLVLLTASYVFYAWWDYRFCGLMAASSLVDYGVGIALGATDVRWKRRLLLTVSVVVNICLLATFKYFNFFIDNVAEVAQALGLNIAVPSLHLVLPVGISFYTFQTMSYSIDVYRRELKPTNHLVDYLAYVSFFPQLVAGPIERGKQLIPQFLEPRSFSAEAASDGCRQILWGFLKKLLLADPLGALIVDPVYANPDAHGGPFLVLATVAFAFQIYCDFSAYSDIAVGSARLFGFNLMRNFAHPYFSQSVGEFWRRWHISLSTWFRDYLFIPLGGSRVPKGRLALNLLITFGISGLWHGASWTFVIWGLLNGLFVIPAALWFRTHRSPAQDLPGGPGLFPSPKALAAMLLTFFQINLTWVFFRAESLRDAMQILTRSTTGILDYSGWSELRDWVEPRHHASLLLMLAAFVLVQWMTRRHVHPLVSLHRFPLPVRWAAYTLMIWGTLAYGIESQAEFIYFQF